MIGGGLAGAAVSFALGRLGLPVTLIDAGQGPASGASGLPVGMLSPHTTAQPTPLSRLCERGVEKTLAHLHALLPAGQGWQRCEVDNHRHDAGRCPATMVRPAALVQAWLRQTEAQGRLQTHWGTRLERLVFNSEGNGDGHGRWCAIDSEGRTTAQADAVVVCSAHGSAQLLATWAPHAATTLPLRPVKGQLSFGPQMGAPLAERPQRLNGVFIPRYTEHNPTGAEPTSIWAMGSTFERGLDDTRVTEDGHRHNLEHLAEISATAAAALQSPPARQHLQGWAGVRCATLDRLPMVGALPHLSTDPCSWKGRRPPLQSMPRWPGLYSLSGLGSRGLALAALCAEALAHQITTGQDPAADLMPPDLWAALDPARFLWRRWHALASEACSA